jgi:hypothetical protein
MRRLLNESPYARWGVLVLLGLTQEFAFTNTQYGLFVSFYAVPNTFLLMAVLGAIILKRADSRNHYGVELPLNKK